MKVEIKKLGEEIICDALVGVTCLNDPDELKKLCLQALEKGDCHVVPDTPPIFHKFKDKDGKHGDGVTGLVVIEESHFHISSWTEESYVQININTCGHIAKPMIALGYLLYELKVIKSTMQVIERGVLIK